MTIHTVARDGITTITLARPEKRNALTSAMYLAMADSLGAAEADPAIRVLLLTGLGEVFCAGNDLDDFRDVPASLQDAAPGRLMRAMLDCRKPIVAAVAGQAIGIGATLLLHCDCVLMCTDAQLIFPFVRLGLVPEFASTLLLTQRIGYLRAARALLLGDAISAAEALELGLATAVLPARDLADQALRTAQTLRAQSADALRLTKALMRAGTEAAVREAIDRENAAFIERLRNPEVQAGLRLMRAPRGARTERNA